MTGSPLWNRKGGIRSFFAKHGAKAVAGAAIGAAAINTVNPLRAVNSQQHFSNHRHGDPADVTSLWLFAILIFFIDWAVFSFSRSFGFFVASFGLYVFMGLVVWSRYNRLNPQGSVSWVWSLVYVVVLMGMLNLLGDSLRDLPLLETFPLQLIYIVVTMLVTAILPHQNETFKWIMQKTLFAWALPSFLRVLMAHQTSIEAVFGVFGGAIFASALTTTIFGLSVPILISYFGGWFGYFTSIKAQTSKAARILHEFMIILLFVMIISPIAVGWQASYLGGGDEQYQFNLPTPQEFFVQSFAGVKNFVLSPFNLGQPVDVDGVNNTQSPRFRSLVENAQNRELGVQLSYSQPYNSPFYINCDSDCQNLIDGRDTDPIIGWSTEMRAQTYAEGMNVELFCRYEWGSGTNPSSHDWPATISEVYVQYTGEFIDRRPFECVIPVTPQTTHPDEPYLLGVITDDNDISIANLLWETDIRNAYGRFSSVAQFPMKTWAYVELVFMEQSQILAMRQAGQDPWREMRIDRQATARQTPGPITLGIMDAVSLPIGVDASNPGRTFLPRFGVSVSNAWAGRGEVLGSFNMTIGIPSPFEFDVTSQTVLEKCTNLNSGVGFSAEQDPERPSYTLYHFNNVSFPNNRINLQQITCPFKPFEEEDYLSLLQFDLSHKFFTFTTEVSYNYETSSSVPANIQVIREGDLAR